jgi:AcrR family transcriptional regulator
VPRGIAIPELHERLFQAAERVLLRAGPVGLSTRAITSEAGCAKGVLHNHFADLDDFLTQYVLARFHAALHGVADLPSRAGQATVIENLTQATTSLFDPSVLAAHAIVTYRPDVATRLRRGRGHRSASLADLERIIAGYLEAEKDHGRVPASVDSPALALALVATIHHLLMIGRNHRGNPHQTFTRVVTALLVTTASELEST